MWNRHTECAELLKKHGAEIKPDDEQSDEGVQQMLAMDLAKRELWKTSNNHQATRIQELIDGGGDLIDPNARIKKEDLDGKGEA